ncbi:hypothetical protein EMPS_00098 [Entomortierella parvispora]|uniref:Arm-like repeat domain-containing protein n=1 Tax=Entomortierella parvispora TaxID=205924 RepID=A0A9P3GZM8_9FUNG|nr:hypothetical protein EMPS_00098 [Entomortierella parvispora]
MDRQYHILLLAASRVLDAMVDADVGDVDRVNLHGPLSELLQGSESSDNPYLAFQANATQALLNVSDDDDIWHAGFRRLWLVLKGGAGLAKIPDPRELKDILEGLEKLYDVGKAGVRNLKGILRTIEDGGTSTFTVKEGLKFKSAWYRALRTAEWYIETGRLVQFKELVTTTPCRHKFIFQWGICQLLGQFAVHTQWSLNSRQDAISFLGALYMDNGLWIRQEKIDQVVFDVLINVLSNNDMHFEVAKSLLEEVRKLNTHLNSTSHQQLPFCINDKSASSSGHYSTNISLIKAVQDRNHHLGSIWQLLALTANGNQPSGTTMRNIRGGRQDEQGADSMEMRNGYVDSEG